MKKTICKPKDYPGKKTNFFRNVTSALAISLALNGGLGIAKAYADDTNCTKTSTQTLEVPNHYLKNPRIEIYSGDAREENLMQIIQLHSEGTEESGRYNRNEKHGFDIVPGKILNVINYTEIDAEQKTQKVAYIEDVNYRGTSVVVPNTADVKFVIPNDYGGETKIIGISENEEINDYLKDALAEKGDEPRFLLTSDELVELGGILGVGSGMARGTIPIQIQVYKPGCNLPASGNLLFDIEDEKILDDAEDYFSETISNLDDYYATADSLRAELEKCKEQAKSKPRIIVKEQKKLGLLVGAQLSSDDIDNPDQSRIFIQVPYKNSRILATQFSGDGPKRDRGYEAVLSVPLRSFLLYSSFNMHSISADMGDPKKDFGNDANLAVGASLIKKPIIGVSLLNNYEWSDIKAANSTSRKTVYGLRGGLLLKNNMPIVLQYNGNDDFQKNLGLYAGIINPYEFERFLHMNNAGNLLGIETLTMNCDNYALIGAHGRYNDRDIADNGRSGNGEYTGIEGLVAAGKGSIDGYAKLYYDKISEAFPPARYFSEILQQWIEIEPGLNFSKGKWKATLGFTKCFDNLLFINLDMTYDDGKINRGSIGASLKL